MFIHELTIRVRYAETDQMGYVYHGNYATYYEVARVETLRALGIRYKDMEADGVLLPVLENHSVFLAPAEYDDLLTIKVFIKEAPNVRIKFAYEFFKEDGKLIHIGETLLVFMRQDTRKPCRVPAVLAEKLSPYFK